MVVNLVDLMEECYVLQIEDILVAVDLYYYLAYYIGVDYYIDFEEVYYFHFEEIAAADYCYCCIDFEEIDYIDLEDFVVDYYYYIDYCYIDYYIDYYYIDFDYCYYIDFDYFEGIVDY